MSHSWGARAFTVLAENASKKTQATVASRPEVFASHDNLNFPKRVFSQRESHQNNFITATAGTIYEPPADAQLPPDIAARVKTQRREGAKEPFDLSSLIADEQESQSRVNAQARHRILRFLLESPAFASYPHHDDPLLAPPPPVEAKPEALPQSSRRPLGPLSQWHGGATLRVPGAGAQGLKRFHHPPSMLVCLPAPWKAGEVSS